MRPAVVVLAFLLGMALVPPPAAADDASSYLGLASCSPSSGSGALGIPEGVAHSVSRSGRLELWMTGMGGDPFGPCTFEVVVTSYAFHGVGAGGTVTDEVSAPCQAHLAATCTAVHAFNWSVEALFPVDLPPDASVTVALTVAYELRVNGVRPLAYFPSGNRTLLVAPGSQE